MASVQQIAPGVVNVVVSPELFLAAQHEHIAISPGVLGRNETVQRVIGESLAAVGVFVIGNAVDVPVVAVAQVEVMADGKDGLAGRRGRHVDGLETVVVAEGIGDAELKWSAKGSEGEIIESHRLLRSSKTKGELLSKQWGTRALP
ncbi:MAG TPA: hypothetical protein VF532_20515 [Candidatus Angelobacter sp.]